MLNKKIVLGLMFAGFGMQMQAWDLRNELGQTELIDYVIKQEADIAAINKDTKRLYDICFEEVRVFEGYSYKMDRYGVYRSTPEYGIETRRRATCMDSDILAWKNRQEDVDNCIDATVSQIKSLVASGEQVNAQDNAGKTALNYTQTYAVYKVLVDNGAGFQPLVWGYFNPLTATCAVTATLVATAVVYCAIR